MRLFTLLFLLAGSLFAQQPVSLFSNASLPTIAPPGTSAGQIPNFSQIGHQVYLLYSNAPSHTCSTPAGTAELEYSFDNSTWQPFGTPNANIALPASGLVQLYQGGGSFSYVRFNLTGFDNANCRASAWYTGTLTGPPVQSVQGQLPVNANLFGNNAWVLSPIFMGGVGTSEKLQPLYVCDNSAQATITAGNTTRIVQALFYPITVCAFGVSISANGTFQFVQGQGTNCATSQTAVSPAWPLAANTPFALGSGTGRLFQVLGSNDLCVTATGGNVSVFVSTAQ